MPFEEAISEARLLKKAFDELSCPQQVILKAFYGLDLNEHELGYWSILQGYADYDELGYPTKVGSCPYQKQEYEELIAVLGRRSGKTDRVGSLALAYEATLGGHTKFVRPGQEALILFIAQDLDASKMNMTFVAQNIETSPLLSKEMVKVDIEKIVFKNGIRVVPETPSIKSARGFAIPAVLFDEMAFWFKDAKAANPDFEVERAVMSAMNQFEFPKRFKLSTPWTMEGMLYKGFLAGTEGAKIRCEKCPQSEVRFCPHKRDERDEFKDVLVVHAPTTVMTGPASGMKTPIVSHKRLQIKRNKDREAFNREELATFIRTIDGFLNEKAVEASIDSGIIERAKDAKLDSAIYVAAMDPAFRHDSFAFTIGHADPKVGIVQDYLKEWIPEKGEKLTPGPILDEIKLKLEEYGATLVYSDQYQLESLQQLAADRSFAIIGMDFTGKSKAKICGSLSTLVNQRRMRLLDNEIQKTQLLKLQKTITSGGTIQIAAPPGQHDDVAMVTMLMAHQAVWLLPTDMGGEDESKKDPTPLQRGLEQIERNRQMEANGDNIWDSLD